MLRIFTHSIIVLLIFFSQIFISGLPANFNSANLILVSLIFYLVFDDMKTLFYWLLALGVMLESVTYLPFGAIIISLSVSVFVAYLLLNSWLTNRSLYSLLILTAVVTLVNNIALWLYSSMAGMVNDQFFMLDHSLIIKRLAWSLALNSLLMIVIFYALNFINPRLKPFLLLRHR